MKIQCLENLLCVRVHRTKVKQNEKNKSSITVFANKRQSSKQIIMIPNGNGPDRDLADSDGKRATLPIAVSRVRTR